MLEVYDNPRLSKAGPDDLSDALERGEIVYFPQSPVPLPSDSDLAFCRDQLPRLLQLKNISYHLEAGHMSGLDTDDQAVRQRVNKILVTMSKDITDFLSRTAPRLTKDWTAGTCSFRPIQEQGRNLKPHASNELVHIDAGAYGATNGDRILRFFININPHEDRIWATKGTFPELYQRYGAQAKIRPEHVTENYLRKRPLDHLRTGLVNGLVSAGFKMAKVLDSSPYDRVMRQFHNFMKDTRSFQEDSLGHEELHFPPYSAWMVFTDMVSHASVSGQFCFVLTGIVRLNNCRLPEFAPYNILRESGNVNIPER